MMSSSVVAHGKRENLEAYGFTRAQVQKMCVAFPGILGCTEARTRTALMVMEEIGCDPLTKPQRLMFSPDLLRARLRFLKTKGLGGKEVLHHVFASNEQFERRWGVSRAQLLTKSST